MSNYTNQSQLYSYQFLKEWNRRRSSEYIVEIDETELEAETSLAHLTPKYSDTPPAAGQIRLLSGTSAPLEVLLFKQTGKEWIVIPLSDIPYPATELEAVFNPSSQKPRVYQLWGWFTYPAIALEQRSWFLTQISREELKEVSVLLQGYFSGKEIPKYLQQHCGTKIDFEFDDRLIYESEATALLQEAQEAGEQIRLEETCLIWRSKLQRSLLVSDDHYEYQYAAASESDEKQTIIVARGNPENVASVKPIGTLHYAMPLDECVVKQGSTLSTLVWERENSIPDDATIILYDFKHDYILGTCRIEDDALLYEPQEPAPHDINLVEDLVLIHLDQ